MEIFLGWVVKFVINYFMYTSGGKDMKQSDGAAIGDIISQALAMMIGNEFDEIFGVPTKMFRLQE